MCVVVWTTAGTLESLSAMTSARSSCRGTLATAIRSHSPVTEYTSLMPSMADISSAVSGMRAASVLIRTNAVTTFEPFQSVPPQQSPAAVSLLPAYYTGGHLPDAFHGRDTSGMW